MAKLSNLKIGEVSFCKLGMNQHAKVALFKSQDAVPTPIALAKKTFDEALRGQLISDQISEVFWRAFDKQYAVREAFREALADELADGGDGTVATEGFTEAMRTIAETAATLAREAGADADQQDLESAVEQAVEKWLNEETSVMKITTKAALKAAVAAFDPAVTPVAQVAVIKSAAKELNAEDELPAEGPLAVEKSVQQDPQLAKALREIDVLKMTPEVRKHFDGLDETAQTAFLAKSEADRASEVEAINKGDPVLYTTADGTVIRKSDGATAAILAKRLDENTAELTKLRDKGAVDAVEKRATEEFPNVAKATAVSMLKSAAQVGEDTDAGKDVLKALAAMNKGAGTLYKSLGSSEAPELPETVEKSRSDFNAEVTKIRARDSIGVAEAMSKARTEHPDLFAQAYPDTADQDA